MNHKKHTPRALVASVMSLVLCLALLLGTTMAWFTDSATNTGNLIQAGELSIRTVGYRWNTETKEWDSLNPLPKYPLIENTTWEPGQYNAVIVMVSNLHSTLAAKVELDFDIVSSTNQLEDALWYRVTPYVVNETRYEDKISEDLHYLNSRPSSADTEVTCMAQIEGDTTAPVVLSDAPYAYYLIEYGMYTDAGNSYQGGSIGLDLHINATQAPVEEDGFGNSDYDANAGYENEIFYNDFAAIGDWNGGEVVDGELIPQAGIYSWYNNYDNKNVRLSDTWTASVDICIDPTVEGNLFEITNAVNRKEAEANGNLHLRDFVLRIQKIDNSTYGIAMSNNANTNVQPDITKYSGYVGNVQPGWYTMKWEYSVSEEQALTCTMSLVDRATGETVATRTLSNEADTNDLVGFNHYLWVYAVNDFAAFHLDNQKLAM